MLKRLLPVLQPLRRWPMKSNACNPLLRQNSTGTGKVYSVFEPDYLDSLKPEFPEYEKLNVAIKGHDYPILENYQRYLHSVAEYMEFDVSDCYALPAQETVVQRLRPNSTVIDAEYKLTTYERNLEMHNVPAPKMPLYIRIAQAALPEGVTLSVMEHNEDCEERRYVPDRDLLELKAELERMGGSRENKKK